MKKTFVFGLAMLSMLLALTAAGDSAAVPGVNLRERPLTGFSAYSLTLADRDRSSAAAPTTAPVIR